MISNREYDIRCSAQCAALECAMATLVVLSRDASGVEWVPQAVSFRHSRKSALSAYALLGDNVTFDQPRTELRIARATLATPMLETDPVLHDMLQRCATAQLDAMPTAAPTTTDVRHALIKLLPSHEATLETVAATLETSARVLQRKLSAEGTSFRGVAERVRESTAKRYLCETQLTTMDVALLLDYCDAPTFHRAFKRWTGMSPGEFRRSITPAH